MYNAMNYSWNMFIQEQMLLCHDSVNITVDVYNTLESHTADLVTLHCRYKLVCCNTCMEAEHTLINISLYVRHDSH